MKKVLIILIVLFIGKGFSQQDFEKEIIKNIVVEMWDAVEKEDIERYAKYIHQDYTWFGENAKEIAKGKDNEVASIKGWIDSADNIKTIMKDPDVTIKGNIAWITYIWNDEGTENGKKFTSKGKSTRIFIKENNKWLCIHSHYTYL